MPNFPMPNNRGILSAKIQKFKKKGRKTKIKFLRNIQQVNSNGHYLRSAPLKIKTLFKRNHPYSHLVRGEMVQ